MTDKTKVKYVSDVLIEDDDVQIKRPFKIKNENKRRFVRLEISSPLKLRNIKEDFQMMSDEKLYDMEGLILNISAGGLLAEIEKAVSEEDFLLMKFTIQDELTIENVLGVVKRVETEDMFSLAGIEFVEPKILLDRFSTPEIELLQEKIYNFHDSVHETLSRYISKE